MTSKERIETWKRWKSYVSNKPKKYRINNSFSVKNGLYRPRLQMRIVSPPGRPRIEMWETIEEMPSWSLPRGEQLKSPLHKKLRSYIEKRKRDYEYTTSRKTGATASYCDNSIFGSTAMDTAVFSSMTTSMFD